MTTERLTPEQLHATAREVAAALGAGWKYRDEDPSNHWAHVDHVDGYGFGIEGGWRNPGMITVSAVYPKNSDGQQVSLPYGKHFPSIRVSLSRGVAVLAKEIRRRFLPAYLGLWYEMKKSADASDEWHRKADASARELAAIIGGRVEADRANGRSARDLAGRFSLHDSNYSRSVEGRCSDSRVTLTFDSLTSATAKRLLEEYRKATDLT